MATPASGTPEPQAPADARARPAAGAVAPGSEPEAAPDTLVQEARLGSTEAGTAANEALRSLSRAARSFLIYDTHNEAIRAFLGSYKIDMEAALAFGPLELEVRPFEMLLDHEVVYLERDRGRSLAFRLFRDGVRRLDIQPEVQWEELLRLLQILSIRYTGVRQHEDDIVTLLWKAGFLHISVVAVEGFVADEEELGDQDGLRRSRKERAAHHGVHVDVPRDWDLPAPELTESGGALVYQELYEEAVSAVRAEVASMNLPEHALTLVSRLLACVADPTETVTLADVAPLVGEVRDFLLSEGQLQRLLQLVQVLGTVRELDADWVNHEIRAATGVRAMRRILHTLPKGIQKAPPVLVELVRVSNREPVSVMVEALGTESTARARRVVQDLLAGVVLEYLAEVEAALRVTPSEIAAVLFGAVVEADSAQALPMVGILQERKDRELDHELLAFALLEAAAPQRRKLLEGLVRSGALQVRLEAIRRLRQEKDLRVGPVFLARLEEEGETLTEQEAIALGEGLFELAGERILGRMAGWVKPKNLRDMVGGVTLSGRMRQYAGVAGLGMSEHPEAEVLIRWLSTRVDPDLHAHCMRTVVKRRRRKAGMAHG